MSEQGLPEDNRCPPVVVLPWKSQTISELAKALSKAQGEMTGAKKDSENPFFKSRYADLASVWDACRAALSANGLAVVQIADSVGGQVTVQTTLLHASGEWMSGSLSMTPTKADPQGFGSAISYARRYALAAMVGVYQEDDDANKASVTEGSGLKAPQKKAAEPPKDTKPATPPDGPPADKSLISEAQRKRLYAIWHQAGWKDEEFKAVLKECYAIDSTTEIKKADYEHICELATAGKPGTGA